MKKFISIIFVLILLLNCNESVIEVPEEYQSNIVLRDNLSESEFQKALIGLWENKFEKQGKKMLKCWTLSKIIQLK